MKVADYSRPRTLAFHGLSEWQVTTHSGEIIIIYAHSVREDEGCYVFDIAIAGSPLSLLPVAKYPSSWSLNMSQPTLDCRIRRTKRAS
jgi:hypothetical protein